MPYDSDADVPSHVPASKRSKWREVWNSAYKRALDKEMGQKEAEASAFRQANGVALSESIAQFFSEIPSGTPKIPSQLVVYMELPGAKKDGECLLVEVAGGISMQHGCCDIWDDIPGENAASFQCGTCIYHTHEEHGKHLSDGGGSVKDCGPDKKAVGGECVTRSQFLIVGDADKKETWKLPVHDKDHIQNALARFNQTEGRTPSVARRLANLARKNGIDIEEFKKHLSEDAVTRDYASVILGPPRLFATDIVCLTGVAPTNIPVAYTGTFWKDGDRFKITRDDLLSIVRNFKQKPTGDINIDYEHASEMPEIAKGGPVPSAGAVKELWMDESSGEPVLMGMPDWTELAKHLIETKQYRFVSAALDWDARDKHTGKPQGTTMTSMALTNRPFLERQAPLVMSETPRLFTDLPEEVQMPDNKQYRVRKLVDGTGVHFQLCEPGTGEGNEAFGAVMGEVFPADFKALTVEGGTSPSSSTTTPQDKAKLAELAETFKKKARRFAAKAAGKSTPSSSSSSTSTSKELSEHDMMNLFGESITLSEAKKRHDAGKTALMVEAGKSGHKLLAETVKPEGWDKRKARTLLSEGKVSPQQYAAFENAIELVEQGVKEGKIHAAHRNYYLADAINRPAEFEAMLKTAKPIIIFEEHGLSGVSSAGGTIEMTEHDQLRAKALDYQKAHAGCSYTKALKAVAGNDPALGKRLREESSGARRLV